MPPVTDTKGLLISAIRDDDPVLFLEHRKLYGIKGPVPEDEYTIPFGKADIRRSGNDTTIVATSWMANLACEVGDELEHEGFNLEIIDPRTLIPLDKKTIIESVKKTGKIILSSDACERGSHLKDMAETICELTFDYLDAPPIVVGSHNWITPAYELEEYFFPQPEWIIDAIHEKIMPLKGHIVRNNFTKNEQIRLNKLGI